MTHPQDETSHTATDSGPAAGQQPDPDLSDASDKLSNALDKSEPQGTPPETPDPRTQLDPDTDDGVYDSGNREPLGQAGKRGLRQRAQQAERERDELASRVERFARNDAQRIAGELLTDPADLWHGGVKLADVLDDDGDVDPEKVRAVARDVAAQHPHWARGTAAPPADQVTSDGKIDHRQQIDAAGLFGGALKAAAQRGRAAHPNN